jgi:hypothetical protein
VPDFAPLDRGDARGGALGEDETQLQTPGRLPTHDPARERRTVPKWVVVCLVVGLLVVPTAAVAATITSYHLIGQGGVPVNATNVGQVETASNNPSLARAFHYTNLTGSDCTAVYTAPSGWAFVLESLTVDIVQPQTPGPGINVRIATDPQCNAELGDVNPIGVGATSIPMTPGIVLPSGDSLYAIADNGVVAEVYGFGYIEPVADAPTLTSGQPGSAQAHHTRNQRGHA